MKMINKQKYIDPIQRGLQKIQLADKFLIIIMLIMLIQSMYSLFFNEVYNEFTTSIDVVVRTSIAGIFGYFVSVNFIKNETKENRQESEDITISNQSLEKNGKSLNSFRCMNAYRAQMFIVGIVCILSLLMLLISRNFSNLNHANMPFVILFRDLVSGSVGFFIGMPNEKQRKNC